MLVVDGVNIDAGRTRIVENISFRIAAGQRVGLLGASGSGKSLTASAIIGHLPPGITSSGHITVDGHDVAGLPTPRRPLSARPAMVFQDSATALNPMVTVGAQLSAPARRTKSDATAILEQVGFREPERILAAYPLELSGGQRQRACIALALACRSPLLVADEPTTALDVTVQRQILALLRDLQTRHRAAVLFVTHDLGVVAKVCDRVTVLHAGRVLEQGACADVIERPVHPYTQALLAATPRFDRPADVLSPVPAELASALWQEAAAWDARQAGGVR